VTEELRIVDENQTFRAESRKLSPCFTTTQSLFPLPRHVLRSLEPPMITESKTSRIEPNITVVELDPDLESSCRNLSAGNAAGWIVTK
jgi:hypothetical protein